jgi:hypothetical protein
MLPLIKAKIKYRKRKIFIHEGNRSKGGKHHWVMVSGLVWEPNKFYLWWF